MNSSGEAIAAVSGYYKVPPGRLLVIVDDADLPWVNSGKGQRQFGRASWIESIEQHMGTRGYGGCSGIGRQPAVRKLRERPGRFAPTSWMSSKVWTGRRAWCNAG
jgi:peptidyl-tRNA hydrolase